MAVRRQPIPFGKYFLLDRINIGGMAEVWRAKTFGEQGFEKLVAIKRILPNIAEDDEFITMFIDEAKITVQLTHANIAQVFDLGKIGDSYFIAMEYVAGKDLRAIFDRCRKKGEPAPIPMVCFMAAKMCEGLDYAHRKRDSASRELHIVHRDVSPQNCLVSFEGEIKVIDFGIAKAANKATKTQAGILKGKFGYMSPEQVRGLPLDQRSDVFAAGVVLYEMLTGERLFIGDSDFSVLEKVRQVDILPPTKYNRRIPEGLERIVLKALAKDAEERYSWASDLADALQRFLIINDNIFSRKDLAQYMKSTFAEDVEKEKVRQAEYAEIKLPPTLAAGVGPGATPGMRVTSNPSGGRGPALRPQPPPPTPAAPAHGPALAAYMQETAPEVADRTVIDGHDVFADAAPQAPQATPAARTTLAKPAPSQLDADEMLFEAKPGNGAEAQASEAPVTPAPRATPTPQPETEPVTSPPQRPAPMIGRPLPAGMGEPIRPGPPVVAGRPPTPKPGPSGPYKPRLPDLEKVNPSETSGGLTLFGATRAKMIIIALIAGIVAMLAAGGAWYLLSGAGTIIVDYDPEDARVFVDGNEVCPVAPCAANDIKAGRRRLEIRKDRYESYLAVIDVPRGEIYRSGKIRLKPLISSVSLVVASDPSDAEVKVDGKTVKDLGRRGMYSGELSVGEGHEVEVAKPGYAPWKKTITPGVGDKAINEFAQLARQPMVIKFLSTPAGAKVLIDDKPRGSTPFDLEDLDPSVPHTVVFQKACYKDVTHTLLAGSASQDVDKKLEKKPNCPPAAPRPDPNE